MQEKIMNPKTGRLIKKGGKTHLDLLKGQNNGQWIEKVVNPKTGRLIKKDGEAYKKLKDENLKTVKMTRSFSPLKQFSIPETIQQYPIDRSEVKWGSKKPQTAKERQFIKEKCGESCFLMPEFNKFPICNKTLPCTFNCRGLKAASSRAGEWKYQTILERSKDLTTKFKCYKKKIYE
jgi:hypothetical protein